MDYVSIAITIIIAVISFIITYRQTIGARRERIISAYNEIIKMLTRSLVDNDYLPSIAEINRLIQAKCLEKRIKITDLPDEVVFIHVLYTKIFESEILSSDKRTELTDKINSYLKDAQEKELYLLNEEKKLIERDWKYRIFLTLFYIFVTTLSAFLINFLWGKAINIVSIFTILVVVAAVSIAMSSFVKLQDIQVEPTASRKSRIEEYRSFEDDILKIVRGFDEVKRNLSVIKDSRAVTFDISFEKSNKTFLVETKMVRTYVSRKFIRILENQAKLAREIDRDYILILVVDNKKYLTKYLGELSRIWDYIFDTDELREFSTKLSKTPVSSVPR